MRNNEKENMKTQHTFKRMDFAQWYDKHDVHHAVTVLEVDNDEFDSTLVKIHYYTGIEMHEMVTKWVPVSQLIPMIGANPNHVDPSGYWPGTPDKTGAEPYGQWNNG